jgi:hypothetical protein
VEKTGKPADALAALTVFEERYAKSKLLPDVHLLRASAVEKQKGPCRETLEAYRKVAADHAGTEVGKKAAARVAEIEKAANVLERRFGREFVRKFVVLKEVYEKADTFVVIVQLSTELSQRQVQATVEDALLQTYEKRREPSHSVQVKAYFNYPLTKAGEVSWRPGEEPVYKIEERKTEDVIKDVFIDLLKRR